MRTRARGVLGGHCQQPNSLCRVQEEVFRCLDGVLHEHGDGHGSHTSGDRGDVTGLLSYL